MTRREREGGWVLEVLEAAGVSPVTVTRDRAWALCPWHQKPEDPKSWATTFFVRLRGTRRDREQRQYDATGQYMCFACGEGGPLRKLVAKVRDIDEEAAREFIRKRGGPRGGSSKVEELTRAVTVVRVERLGRLPRFRLPREVILEPLRAWVTPAREYAEGRGISAEEVDLFGLGYAVDGSKLGGRIILPWRAADGTPAGYSARTYVDAEPKYTTPAPEENADRTVMFGEHVWPRARAERELVVVTEGALNALAARRVLPGVPVAALGGSNNFDAEQAKKLATFRRALLLTDPDAAGEKAARDLSLMIGRYVDLRRVSLPAGKDALDVWRDDPERLRRALSRALRDVS